jgi:hypothetical protein
MHELDLTLQMYLGFSDSDLNANRADRLSQHQRVKLQDNSRLGFAIMAFIVFILIMSFSSRLSATHNPLSVVCSSAPVLLIIGIFLITLFPRWRQYQQDLQAGQVTHVTGYIRKQTHSGRKSNQSYEILVHDRIFKVDSKIFSAFVEGWRYTIYYTPFSRTIVAAELVSDIVPLL